MREIIIVGVYNTVNRAAEYSDTTAGRAYMNFLAHTLKPFIDSNYRTLPGPEYTATMGSSMGGLISFLIAWHHPEVFSQAGCLSPAFIFQNYKSVKMVNAYRGPAKPIRIYMDNGGVGLEDTLQYGCDKMLAALRQAGFKDGDNLEWFYDETAEHNEAAWAKRVWRPLLFLYGLKNKK
jgi:predicted alpha/beta superfamily hydrolase